MNQPILYRPIKAILLFKISQLSGQIISCQSKGARKTCHTTVGEENIVCWF